MNVLRLPLIDFVDSIEKSRFSMRLKFKNYGTIISKKIIRLFQHEHLNVVGPLKAFY